MEKIKTILDREPLSSDYIASKQDFANVVKGAKGLGKPYWKTNWFAGTVSVAAVAVIVTAVTLNSSEDPVKEPVKDIVVAMQADTNSDDKPSERVAHDEVNADIPEVDETEQNSNEAPKPEVTLPETTPSVDTQEVQASRVAASNSEENAEADNNSIALPNIAGVTEGAISFKDFCDPVGIQVGDGILIHQYTIQYRSCSRDLTYRIRGNKLPGDLCREIADCGSPIEVTFSNFKAENRDGEPVKLQAFSLVTSPKF